MADPVETLMKLLAQSRADSETLLMLQARSVALQVEAKAKDAPLATIQDAEFKVFSQFGEDGILQYLIRETGITRDEETFVEFGVADYFESNTRYLLQGHHWRGLVMDGNADYMNAIRNHKMYWRGDLTANAAWIDREGINDLISGAGFAGDIGLLSVDIDGMDYWVWERLDVVNPVIVVAEYNSVFGAEHAVTIPYDPQFQRTRAHFSNLYWGTSLKALATLAESKGFALVGSNRAGHNAFFVRHDRLGRLRPLTVAEAYVESRYRESRDQQGRLTYLGGRQRAEMIGHLPLVDVTTGATTTLRELNAGTVSVG